MLVSNVALHLAITHLLLFQNMSQVHGLHVLLQETFYVVEKKIITIHIVCNGIRITRGMMLFRCQWEWTHFLYCISDIIMQQN